MPWCPQRLARGASIYNCKAPQKSECTGQQSFGLKTVPLEGLLAVCESSVKKILSALIEFQSRGSVDKWVWQIYARYTAASFNKTKMNQWDDIPGNGRHSVEWRGSNFRVQNVTGNGMNRTVLAVYSNTNTGVKFPTGSLPGTFTICTLSKYGAGSQQRIGGLADGNWLHGHWAGRAGVAYCEFWRTSSENLVTPSTDWVVMCGQNAEGNIMLTNGRSVSEWESERKSESQRERERGTDSEKRRICNMASQPTQPSFMWIDTHFLYFLLGKLLGTPQIHLDHLTMWPQFSYWQLTSLSPLSLFPLSLICCSVLPW